MGTSHRNALQRSREQISYEYYTQYQDIENELSHYFDFFKDKTVLCNCDDAEMSNFFRYFFDNFERLQLKRLITTCYRGTRTSFLATKSAMKTVVEWGRNGLEIHKLPLKGSGSWDSTEVLDEVESCDVIVTNPAFNQFKDFIDMCLDSGKKFLVLGPPLKIFHVWEAVRDNRIWAGSRSQMSGKFEVPESYRYTQSDIIEEDGKYYKWVAVAWFTNIEHDNMNKPLLLTQTYNPKVHPTYDNYPAIECKYVKNIPCDYMGVIGVPVTYLFKHNPEQFEIVGTDKGKLLLRGHPPFDRILIRRR